MRELRSFRIPGDACAPWDAEVHGLPYDDEGDLELSAAVVPVDWRPGEYHFSFGCCGNAYVISVPERPESFSPSQDILRGIHAFLTEALPSG